MSSNGAPEPQFRAAVVGAGPAGFYAAESLLKSSDPVFEVDLLERLPMPYGLVRYGVAPDHQKIKSVTRAFDKVAQNPRCRFMGNVRLGRDVQLSELLERYNLVILCLGCETDRKLDVPGEDLQGYYPATRFVAWYNGHPDYRDFKVSLAGSQAVVIGAGDVSLDITRMLCRRAGELADTDIAPYAAQEFAGNQVSKISIVIRRGPEHTPFALKELHDIVELPHVDVRVDREVVRGALANLSDANSTVQRKLDYLAQLAERPEKADAERVVRFLFHRSPVEIQGENGHVSRVRLEKNAVVKDANGVLTARGTGESEWLDAQLVFPAVGYRAEAIEGVPFDERRGIIPNVAGRVLDPMSKKPISGLYTAGWIKRGPSGVIGTNKLDANDTVSAAIEDLKQFSATSTRPGVAALLGERNVRVVTFDDWLKLDQLERTRGEAVGKVREKFTAIDEALAALA